MLHSQSLIFILLASGQSYKASVLVIYDSRVVSISKLLVITRLES